MIHMILYYKIMATVHTTTNLSFITTKTRQKQDKNTTKTRQKLKQNQNMKKLKHFQKIILHKLYIIFLFDFHNMSSNLHG